MRWNNCGTQVEKNGNTNISTAEEEKLFLYDSFETKTGKRYCQNLYKFIKSFLYNATAINTANFALCLNKRKERRA